MNCKSRVLLTNYIVGKVALELQHFSFDHIYKIITTEAFVAIRQLLKKRTFTFCPLKIHEAEAEEGRSRY